MFYDMGRWHSMVILPKVISTLKNFSSITLAFYDTLCQFDSHIYESGHLSAIFITHRWCDFKIVAYDFMGLKTHDM